MQNENCTSRRIIKGCFVGSFRRYRIHCKGFFSQTGHKLIKSKFLNATLFAALKQDLKLDIVRILRIWQEVKNKTNFYVSEEVGLVIFWPIKLICNSEGLLTKIFCSANLHHFPNHFTTFVLAYCVVERDPIAVNEPLFVTMTLSCGTIFLIFFKVKH